MSEETTLVGTFEDIADAIREKGISGTMKAIEMPGKIRQIVQIDPEDYYTRGETSSSSELSTAFSDISSQIDPALRTDVDNKVLIDGLSAASLKVNIMALSTYQEISGGPEFDPTAFYAISDDTGGGGGGGDMSNYYTKDQTSSAVELSSAFANVSVDMSDYATLAQLSSKVLLNEVSADLKIQVMSKADYDVLSSGGGVDPDTFYAISDWQPVDVDNYYTKAQTSSAAQIDAVLGSINDLIAALN